MPLATAAPYDDIADLYDELSPGVGHEAWTTRLLELARSHGPGPSHVLDVGCGSGRSFGPRLAAGCQVVGLDASARMLARARGRHGDAVVLEHGDMRELPVLGAFDLALCLDDALNHLGDARDVRATFEGCAANLVPGGLLLFDVLALGAYRAATDRIVEEPGRLLLWRVPGARDLEPGGAVEMVVDVLEGGDDDGWTRRHWRQPHRHHPVAELRDSLDMAGFDLVRCWGQLRGGVLTDEIDELHQHKLLVLARRR